MTTDPPELLSEQEGRRPPRERWEAVPRSLEQPLRTWLGGFLHRQHELEERIAMRLGLELTPRHRVPTPGGPPRDLARHPELDLLDAIDLALRWDEALAEELDVQLLQQTTRDGTPDVKLPRIGKLNRLRRSLDDGGSTYEVWVAPGAATARLVQRTDPSMQAAADQAIATADQTASTLLRRAWTKAYGRDTDPDGAYLDALRAVEALANPLVLPESTRPNLNSVAQHLRDDSQRPDPSKRKWELVITKHGDGTVDPLVAMFDRLWHGNLASRHGDAEPAYREVTLEEARAGVQVAVVCVQWLTDGVLRRRDSSGTP